MRILAIGHRGYLGHSIFTWLSRRHTTLGWDKEEDLLKLDRAFLEKNGVDAIVNLAVAADRAVAQFQVDTLTDSVNVEGARHLARILKGTQIGWIQMSTREVFGPVYDRADVKRASNGCYRPTFLVNEKHPYLPQNSYGKSKLMAEMISESHPYSSVIRLSTCYTDFPAASGNWVVQILNALLQGRPVSLTRKGLQFRDPLHADDLASLIELVLTKKAYGQKIHAGGGRRNLISLREYVHLIAPKAKVNYLPGGDYGFALDNRKAYALTGWKPGILFRKRIPMLVENARRALSRS